MKSQSYVVPQSTVFRKVGEELVVVQLETSRFYFFNSATEPFLEAFREPRSVESFSKTDSAYLKEFCKVLVEKQLMREAVSEINDSVEAATYEKPELLREADWTLDQLTFTCIP